MPHQLEGFAIFTEGATHCGRVPLNTDWSRRTPARAWQSTGLPQVDPLMPTWPIPRNR